jgi:hypothetical protein
MVECLKEVQNRLYYCRITGEIVIVFNFQSKVAKYKPAEANRAFAHFAKG